MIGAAPLTRVEISRRHYRKIKADPIKYAVYRETHRQISKQRYKLFTHIFSSYKIYTGCERCGYDVCAAALDWHHINPLEKKFILATAHRSIVATFLESMKFKLLCANCHRETHNGS